MDFSTAVLGNLVAGLDLMVGRDGIVWLLGEAHANNLSPFLLLLLDATSAGMTINAYCLLMSTGQFGLQSVVVYISVGLAIPVIYSGTLHYGLMGTAAAVAFMYALRALLADELAAFLLRRGPLHATIRVTGQL